MILHLALGFAAGALLTTAGMVGLILMDAGASVEDGDK